jgi:SPP1 gp7 family putative phage head morphogenesis protein
LKQILSKEEIIKRYKKYWNPRTEKAKDELLDKSIADTEKQLRKYYSTTMQRVVGDFEATYEKLLNRMRDGKQATPADLYALDRYWQMQARLRDELQKLGDKQAALYSKKFVEEYLDFYNFFAIPSQEEYRTISTENAMAAIRQIWCADGKSWSDRVWDNIGKLQQTLNDNLIECVVTGKDTKGLKKLLQDEFTVSYSKADSLVRTEMAHIAKESTVERYRAMGVKRVKVWASKDERRCEICGKLHEEEFDINEKIPIPAHPRCRCTIRPIIE